MSILINKNTRVVTQGITGKTGQFHTRMSRDYANGKNCFVAGVNPKKAGEDFGVCMNPEYLRENRNEEDFKNPWLVTIGELDSKSGEAIEGIYDPHKCPIIHLPLEAAEMQKYVHNLFNACKISFFNEMRVVCEAVNVDADKVFELVVKSAEAQWNPQYGIRDFGAYGGTCLPKDTTAFMAWAKDELGKSMPLLRAVIRVNDITKERKMNGNGLH